MAKEELLIESGPGESRIALVQDGRLTEYWVDRPGGGTMVGNVYLGRVEAVLSGIAAAFVDVGLERAGFLGLAEARPLGAGGPPDDRIGDYLSEGDAVLVQVLRDPVAGKGAKLTTHLTLTGRQLILMPGSDEVRLSHRIDGKDERTRLENIVRGLATENEGFILRTAAAGVTEEDIKAEAERLRAIWTDIGDRAPACRPPICLHAEPGVTRRILRDGVGPQTGRIVVEGPRALAGLRGFCADVAPDVVALLAEHDGAEPLFEAYDVGEQIDAALAPAIGLPSGGRIIIEETAALTAIDVDTGGHGVGGGVEDTALLTNLEAADEIARQMRLRNLAGIVAVDFIPMKKRPNSQAVLDRLRTALAADKTPTNLFGFTRLGLVEMTRQRRSDSLRHLLCEPCAECAGSGWVLNRYSVACEGLRRVLRMARTAPAAKIELIAAPGVIDALKTEAAQALAETEERLGRPLLLSADEGFAAERIEVVANTADRAGK
jgi:ribonuclease G